VGYIFDISGSYINAFLFVAAVAVIGLILAIFLRPTRVEWSRV